MKEVYSDPMMDFTQSHQYQNLGKAQGAPSYFDPHTDAASEVASRCVAAQGEYGLKPHYFGEFGLKKRLGEIVDKPGLSLHNATHPLHWRIYSVGDDRPSSSAPNRPKWSQEYDIGAVKFGEWEDFVVKVKLETTPVGSLVVWRNGKLAVNESSIATAYNDKHPPYIKLGSYLNKPFKAKAGVRTSWWGARYWQLKVGRADSSFAAVSTAHKTKQASDEVALEQQQSTPTSALLKSDDGGVIGLPPSPRPAEPFSAPQPPYPPLDPPFDATWDLARSTIIHTGNGSGFTDGNSASKYGVISFVSALMLSRFDRAVRC